MMPLPASSCACVCAAPHSRRPLTMIGLAGVLAGALAAAAWPVTDAIAAGNGRPIAIAPRGPAKPASAPVEAEVWPEDQARADDEAFRARAESAVLARLDPLIAKRDGLRLRLVPERGRPVMLDSAPATPGDGGTGYVDYRLDGMSKDGRFFIVRATLAAGSELLWISRADGERYEMHGNVLPAPDGRHLVVSHASTGVEFNGIKIWAREGDRLIERYKLQPSQENPIQFRVMRWKDASTIELEQLVEADRTSCPSGVAGSLAVLSRQTGQWMLRSAGSPYCQR